MNYLLHYLKLQNQAVRGERTLKTLVPSAHVGGVVREAPKVTGVRAFTMHWRASQCDACAYLASRQTLPGTGTDFLAVFPPLGGSDSLGILAGEWKSDSCGLHPLTPGSNAGVFKLPR